MAPDLPLTLAVAARLDVLSETGSTNADLRERAADAEAWPHLSALVAAHQTAGRGRLDRTWTAPPGAALAVSVLLRDLPASPSALGWIPLAAGVAMTDAVAAQLPGREVAVKWPNDVLVGGRKICGVLAEAVDGAIIVGAGVNTAMTEGELPVPTATSFAALGAEADVDRLLAAYLGGLAGLVAALASAGDAERSGLRAATIDRCATLGREVRVHLPDGRELVGQATALDADGRLVVAAGGDLHAVAAGDVVHVRPLMP